MPLTSLPSRSPPDLVTNGRNWEWLRGQQFDATDLADGAVGPSELSLPWIAYTPTWTGSGSNPALGNGTIAGRYVQIGKTVHFTVGLLMGSTTTYGSGVYSLSLPVTKSSSAPARTVVGGCEILDNGVKIYSGQAISFSTTTVDPLVILGAAAGAGAGISQCTSVFPFTFGNLDQINLSGTYEAA